MSTTGLLAEALVVLITTLDRNVPFVLDIVAKITVLLAVGIVLAFILRRASSAIRHSLLACMIVGTLLIPLMSFLSPPVRLAVLPQTAPKPMLWQSAAPGHGYVPPHYHLFLYVLQRPTHTQTLHDIKISMHYPTATAATPQTVGAPIGYAGWVVLGPTFWIALLWFSGTLTSLWRLAAGLRKIRSTDSLAEPVGEHIQSLAVEVRQITEVRRSVRVLISSISTSTDVPLTWGVLRPVVLLPIDAENWHDDRLRTVLLHEFVHIKRNDWTIQSISNIALAFYWFHPLMWLVVDLLRSESEIASDDAVLMLGIPSTSSAQVLVDIARSIRVKSSLGRSAIGMASSPEVITRVHAVLDEHRNRRQVTRRKLSFAVGVLFFALLPISALHLSAALANDFKTVRYYTQVETPGGDLLAWQNGKTLPDRVKLVRRGTGRLVFILLPKTGPGTPYSLRFNPGIGLSVYDARYGVWFRDDGQIRSDLKAIFAEGISGPAGFKTENLPFNLWFLNGPCLTYSYDFTASQWSRVQSLNEEAQRWNSFIQGGTYILDDSDVDSASALPDPRNSKMLDLNITLDPAGQQRLAVATAANIGRQMAVVSFKLVSTTPNIGRQPAAVNSNVMISSQTIQQPLTGNTLQISGIDPTTATQIVAAIPSRVFGIYSTKPVDPSITDAAIVTVNSPNETAVLPSGYSVKVDVVQTCCAQEGNWSWVPFGPRWRGDQTVIQQSQSLSELMPTLNQTVFSSGGCPQYSINFEITPPKAARSEISYVEALEGAVDDEGEPSYARAEGSQLSHSADGYFPARSPVATAYVGIGDGPWQTAASANVHFYPRTRNGGPPGIGDGWIFFSNGVTINSFDSQGNYVSTPLLPAGDPVSDDDGWRIVAVDESGNQIPINALHDTDVEIPGGPDDPLRRLNPTLHVDRIKTILLQTRPCQVVRFTNIPLEPKSETNSAGTFGVPL